MKAVVAAFNQEKALVGAFSVITNLRMELFKHYYLVYGLVLVGLLLVPQAIVSGTPLTCKARLGAGCSAEIGCCRREAGTSLCS